MTYDSEIHRRRVRGYEFETTVPWDETIAGMGVADE